MTRASSSSGGKIGGSIREILSIAMALAIVLFARSSLADHYHVPTGSMEPTVHVGDHILVNKAAYGVRVPLSNVEIVRSGEPERGDVVVLESPKDGTVLLKRIVALPGDRVEVRDGAVFIDGSRIEAPRAPADQGPDFGPVTLPPDQFLMLGDNRGNSYDGRMFGTVRRDAILGRAVRVVARGGSLAWVPLGHE